MPKLKEKPKSNKSGSRQQSQPALSSRQAAKLLKDKYIQQLDQRRPETDSAEAQASGQIEDAGSWAVDELTTHVPYFPRQQEHNIKDKSQTMRKTTGKAIPQVSSPAAEIKERPTVASEQQTAGPTIKERPVEGYRQQTAPTIKERPTAASVQPAAGPTIKERQVIVTGQRTAAPAIKERSIIADTLPIRSAQEATGPVSGQAPGSTSELPTAAGYGLDTRPPSSASPVYEHTQAGGRDTAARPDNPLQRKQAIKQHKQQGQRLGPSVSSKSRDGFAPNPPSPGTGEKAPRGRISVGSPTPKTGSASYQKGVSRPKTFGVFPKGKAAVSRPGRAIGQTARHQMKQQAIRQAQKAAKTTAATFKKAVVAVTKAASALINSVAALAGGGVLLMAMVVVILIAAVASSPFGLFFAGERSAPDTVSVAEAVSSVNMAYNAKLEELQAGDYDSVEVNGQAADWAEVLAVFAVKTAGTDGGVDVATLDADRVDRLIAVFWDMTTITTEVETIPHDDSDPDDDVDDSWTEYVLHITITARTADDMRMFYHFTDYQNSALDDLLADRATLVSLAGSLSITNADVQAVLDALPDDLSPERRAVVETALTLYGKVTYFWGGKSLVIGWDSRWGQIKKVTADGNSTTGTYRPYGLDCSGFVDWVFYNATGGSYIIGHGGGAHAQHTYCTGITWTDARPGDLVFYPGDSHVGIVCGRDSGGNLLVIHCASGANNVVITGTSGFTSIGRPNYYGE